jgi:Cu/Ag efflux protein CusF
MKMKATLLVAVIAFALSACGGSTANNRSAPNTSTVGRPVVAAESPIPDTTPMVPKDGDYKGRGKVTKINDQAGSVELDHEDIPGVMPAMKMEFYVRDKVLLKNIKVGDQVDFTLRYKHPSETIVAITKAL